MGMTRSAIREVENQGFNDAKNRYGFEHITHHDANSMLVCWLLLLLALTIERLCRLRYLAMFRILNLIASRR